MAGIAFLAKSLKRSLSHQLLAGFGLSLLTVGAATLGINYQLVKLGLEQQVHARAKATAQTLEFSTEGLLEAESRPILQRVVQNYATLPAVLEVTIVDPSGVILAQGPILSAGDTQYQALYPPLASSLEEARRTGVSTFVETTLNGKAALTYILPFSSPLFSRSGGRRGLAVVKVDLHQIQQEIWPIFLTSTTTMVAGAGVILIAMGGLLKKCVLSPLLKLNETVAESQIEAQFTLPPDLPSHEIGFLAETFERVFQQHQQAEAELRKREAEERENTRQLAAALRELKEAQAQLIQTEKMAGLGQMVAGIAHEINNPISFIHGNLDHVEAHASELLTIISLYQQYFPLPPAELAAAIETTDLAFLQTDLPKIIQSMQSGTQRIREIILSLRNFSRLDEASCKSVDLHEGLDSTLMLLQHRLKAKAGKAFGIRLVKLYGKLPPVECYVAQMNQVFMNLLSNAIDALQGSDSPDPQITLQTERQQNRCIVRVCDNGIGIPPENLSQIFNPFFTTKPIGKGTGLGLAVSYRIVERHGGSLTCLSTPGQGTEFVIDIPIVQTSAAQMSLPTPDAVRLATS
ncbi:MAG: GHKL domain-containing protein [Leptolyngbya sp. SIO4C1]|nr:GHKL domain-containing protein [Leptolyngbya sp. SIO4C1]